MMKEEWDGIHVLGCRRIGECGEFGWGGGVMGIDWVGCGVVLV